MSEVRLVNIAKKKEKEEDKDDEEDSKPLSWGVKKPKAPSAPTHARDQARMDKGKEKVNEKSTMAVRSYTTKGTEKKLLGDAVKASKQKHAYKKR